MRMLTTIILAGAWLTLVSCRQVTGPEPPRILYGQEECVRCRMIVSEERFASALVIRHAEDEYESAAFDDINCLFEHEQSLDDAEIVARYVHDFDTLQWLDLTDACYVHSETLHTPMASGLAAFASREQAIAMLDMHPNGKILDAAAVRVRYMSPVAAARDWANGRFGKEQ